MKFTLLTDIEWDTLLDNSPYRSFFSQSFWKNSVCEMFGGKSELLHCERGSKRWLIPLYRDHPWSQGFRIGAIGYGGPLALQMIDDPIEERRDVLEIVQKLEEFHHCKNTGVSTFPFTKWADLNACQGQIIAETEIIPLGGTIDQTYNDVITGNVRTAIRRAHQGNLEIRILNNNEIESAATLLQETQKSVGASYTTPKAFIEHLYHHSDKGVQCWGVFDTEKVIVSMSVLLIYAKSAFHLFHGWRRNRLPVGANQALIWEMVKSSIKNRCHSFNMGESHASDLKRAKQRWGTQTVPILRF